ncbi:MAG: murein biosynthesis integral membrane protein MurJ [Thermoflexia bacterium]|nr:MAG: murein biosynthesis integral membrane protein MurJ [Thermoflexia bacterium]
MEDNASLEQVRLAQAAGLISLGNIASRVLGLLREMVKSGLFGAGPAVSALNAALRVPLTLYDLLIGGMISSALVPVFSEYASRERAHELWHLLSTLVSGMLLLVGGLLLLGELLAPQLIWLMAGGLDAPDQALAVQLLRIVLPAVLFLNLAGLFSAALYALRRFAYPAFTAAIFNTAVVLTALLLGRWWGVRSMALGLVLGAIAQVALQVPGLKDARLRLTFSVHHPALRRIGLLYLPILLGLIVDNLFSVVLSYHLASHLGGSAIAWMEYAAQIIQFPLGMVVAAVSLATLPTLSRQAGNGDLGPFRQTLAEGLRLVLFLIVPATVALLVLSRPVVALIFEHGDFTPTDTTAVAEVLRYHLPGLFFAAIDQVLIFAFYARKDTLTPALVGVGTTVLYALTAVTLSGLGVLTLPLLVLVNSCKWAAHALTMLVLTRARLGPLGRFGVWRVLAQVAVASGGMALALWGVARPLQALVPPGFLGEVAVVGISGSVGALVYGLLTWRMRIPEGQVLRAALADLMNRRGWMRKMEAFQGPAPSVPPDRYDATYFLSVCEGYEEFLVSEGRELSRRLREAFAVAGIGSGMRVLDVGCGRGEILRHCTRAGAIAYGIDYAQAAVLLSREVVAAGEAAGVYQADARHLPFPDATFDRVLLFDIVEHLYPWELDQAIREARRVLKPDGRLVIHTAPNVWYDRYAYPVVRLVRILMGQGERYPRNPRALIPANLDVHVNEQSALSLWWLLRRHGFRARVWLATPPQNRREGWLLRVARYILFHWPPFRWFFEREVFAVATPVARRSASGPSIPPPFRGTQGV